MTTPNNAKLRSFYESFAADSVERASRSPVPNLLAVDDSEREVRIEAIHALGEIGGPAATALATLDEVSRGLDAAAGEQAVAAGAKICGALQSDRWISRRARR